MAFGRNIATAAISPLNISPRIGISRREETAYQARILHGNRLESGGRSTFLGLRFHWKYCISVPKEEIHRRRGEELIMQVA